ncbi:uncharacterized protein BXZ73DRAFT_58371 [Epithele typhae]|uniref:uncharacterized protein n=1 Tax=Epithele typhae TaxID=378194 RepID=UPI0020071EBC|nr:uncharacterized protein BXZ73DRAFT_58371 [Epithele typhae]KAH9910469.1 hypothetical protein BXZ73DRAFT_58371 [Epithele typhae]
MLETFLLSQLDDNDDSSDDSSAFIQESDRIHGFTCATAVFYAPSDLATPGGMSSEKIRCTPRWWKEHPRYDTVLVSIDADGVGLDGMLVARVRAFFSFKYGGKKYPCALVEWFEYCEDHVDDVTGMWMVQPELHDDGNRVTSIISVDSIVRACHLIGVYGDVDLQAEDFHYSLSLDIFSRFYVNWYIDYHAHEVIC